MAGAHLFNDKMNTSCVGINEEVQGREFN